MQLLKRGKKWKVNREKRGKAEMGMAERITKAQKNVARMGAREADPQLSKQERHGEWLTGTQTGQPRAERKWKRATEMRYRAVSGHNEVFKSWKYLDPNSIPSHSSTSYH